MQKIAQEVAVARMKEIRPEYDYSLFAYNGAAATSVVLCPTHGEFHTSYNTIKGGHGCPKCGIESRTIASTRLTEDVVKSMKTKRPEYGYDRFVHTGNKHKSLVTCPLHGDFQTTYANIMRGRGCPKCGVESRTALRTLDAVTALQRMKSAQPQHDYSNFVFKTSGSKSTVICPVHGEFQSSYNFIINGTGCKKCHFDAISVANRIPFTSFVERAQAVHGDAYSYLEDTYSGMSGNVIAVCSTHGQFLVACGEHIYGQGCPDCKDTQFNPKKRAFLYMYQIIKDGTPYLGYGITGSISRRNAEHQRNLSAVGISGTILHVFRFRRGYLCRAAESALLSVFEQVDLGVRGFRREATHWYNYAKALAVAQDLQRRLGSISDINDAMRIAA